MATADHLILSEWDFGPSDQSSDTSTWLVHVQATAVPPALIVQGVVTAGRFVGDTLIAALLTGQADPLACLTDTGLHVLRQTRKVV